MTVAPDKTYWISFSNGTNKGCCIVDAINPESAHLKTIKLGINPGGELMITEFDDSPDAKKEISKWGKNRLITREELIANHYIPTSDMPEDVQDAILRDPRVTKVCERCNGIKCVCS